MGFKVLGHRGNGRTDNGDLSAGKAPENTLLSFEHAINNGAHGIEFDVMLSADDIPMVCHKSEINGQQISDMTAEEIQKIDLGYNQHIPTLEETLIFIASKQAEKPDKFFTINIDLKGPDVSFRTAEVVLEHIEAGLIINEQVYYNASDWNKLKDIRALDSEAQIVPVLTTGFLFGEDRVQAPDYHVEDDVTYDPVALQALGHFITEYKPCAIDMILSDIRQEMIDFMQERGIGLITTPIGPKREEAAARIFNIVAMLGKYAGQTTTLVALRTDDIEEARNISKDPEATDKKSIERIMGAPFIKL